jgi:hypothetical protein
MAAGTVPAKSINVRLHGCDFAQMFVWRVAFLRALNLVGGVNLAHWPLGIDRKNVKGCRELNGVSVEEAQKAREATVRRRKCIVFSRWRRQGIVSSNSGIQPSSQADHFCYAGLLETYEDESSLVVCRHKSNEPLRDVSIAPNEFDANDNPSANSIDPSPPEAC